MKALLKAERPIPDAPPAWLTVRELTQAEELQAYLRLRYQVYVQAGYLKRNPDQLDLDEFDPYSRFVGAFETGSGRLVGGARVILPGRGPQHSMIQAMSSQAVTPHLRSLPPRQGLCYVEKSFDLTGLLEVCQRQGLRVAEFGRNVCHPDLQGRGIGAALVHAVQGLALNCGVDLGVAGCPPKLADFYGRCGSRVLESQGVARSCGVVQADLVCLVIDLHNLTGPARQTVTAAALLRRHGQLLCCGDRDCLGLHSHAAPGHAPEMEHDWDSLPIMALSGEVHEETLGAGLETPSIVTPTLEDQLRVVHASARLGLESIQLGRPGEGRWLAHQTERLAQEVVEARLPLQTVCSARPQLGDLKAIRKLADRLGTALMAAVSVGSDELDQTRQALRYAREIGQGVTLVALDSIRTAPGELRQLLGLAGDMGVARLVLCDSIGQATPQGTRRLVRFARQAAEEGGFPMPVDWRGYNDRGLGTANALAALEAGARRIHCCALGLGARAGLASTEALLLALERLAGRPLSRPRLHHYLQTAARATGTPLQGEHLSLEARSAR